MCCGLRRHDSLKLTVTELRATFRDALGHAVAHKGCWRRTTWRNSHPAADDGATQRCRPELRQLGPGLQHDTWIDLRAPTSEGKAFLHRQQDLADAEQTDDCDQKVEAAQQL